MRSILICKIIASILMIVEPSSGQVSSVDSLLKAVSTEVDSVKILRLQQAAMQYMYADPERAYMLIVQAEDLARTTLNRSAVVELLNTKGIYYDAMGYGDSAFHYFNLALVQGKAMGYMEVVGRSHNNLGLHSWKTGKFNDALFHFTKAMENDASLPQENREMKAKYLNNIGLIHQDLGQYTKALSYHFDALGLRRQLNITGELAVSHANIGLCYRKMAKSDSALVHLHEAIRLSKIANNQVMYTTLHGSLGNVYFEKGNYNAALEGFLISLGDEQNYARNPKGTFHALSNLCAVYNKLVKPEIALDYARKAEKLLTESPGLLAFAPPLLLSTAQSHYMKGNVELGDQYIEKYAVAKDSLFSSKNAEAMAMMEVKFETEKKEQQIALQEALLAEQQATFSRNMILLSTIILLLLLLAALMAAVINRNKKQAQLLAVEREMLVKETQVNAAIASQEAERKRFARDLHDGFGQLISAMRLSVSRLNDDINIESGKNVAKESDDILREMHSEIRNISFNLMPATLIENGLGAAISEFAERLNTSNQIRIETDTHGMDRRLEELQEIAVYRIVQEWVNNVIKYAGAQRIMIQLVADEDELSIVIEDDGTGFDTSVLGQSAGNGWRNINARAHSVGGEIEIDTIPGRKGSTFIMNTVLQTKTMTSVARA